MSFMGGCSLFFRALLGAPDVRPPPSRKAFSFLPPKTVPLSVGDMVRFLTLICLLGPSLSPPAIVLSSCRSEDFFSSLFASPTCLVPDDERISKYPPFSDSLVVLRAAVHLPTLSPRFSMQRDYLIGLMSFPDSFFVLTYRPPALDSSLSFSSSLFVTTSFTPFFPWPVSGYASQKEQVLHVHSSSTSLENSFLPAHFAVKT